MKRFRKCFSSRGSVSVFLCIAMAGIIMFNCVLIDGARLLTLDKLLQQRLNLSTNSLLADFYARLQEDYGLYGMYVTDSATDKSDVYRYMDSGNLVTDLDLLSYDQDYRQLDLDMYDIKKIKLNYTGCMTDTDVLTEQINGIMKYKTPANSVEVLLDKVGMFTSSAEGADVYAMYNEACSLKDEAAKLVGQLKLAVEGNQYSDASSVNGWAQFEKNFYNIQINILKTAPYIAKKDGGIDVTPGVTAFEVLMTAVNQYKEFNQKALAIIQKIDILRNEIESKIQEFDDFANNNTFDNEIEATYSNMLLEKIKELKAYNSGLLYGTVRDRLSQNVEKFDISSKACIDGISYLRSNGNITLNTAALNDYIQGIDSAKKTESTITIAYPDTRYDESLKNYDRTSQMDTAISKLFSDGTDILIPENMCQLLPSVENGHLGKSKVSGMYDSLSMWTSKTKNIADISNFIPSLEQIGQEAKSSVYLDDYIMTYFNSIMENPQNTERFFEAETEYIIGGQKSQKENMAEIIKQIIAVRFVMNFIHIVSDAQKANFANEIGVAISAATAGIGASIYAFAIMSTWAITEAAIDAYNLLKGESVPFFKQKGDWNLDIGLGNIGSTYLEAIDDETTSASVTSKDSILNMSYNDYIRMLLMFVPKETKLMRICDLIQLNISLEVDEFRIDDTYTGVICDCTVGVNALMGNRKKKVKSYELFFRSDAAY